ncbi:MAG: hypothetical protein IJ555_04480 [Ruminococcus sp.]|nr:hypothetical protein [Ruminococcus sp.]
MKIDVIGEQLPEEEVQAYRKYVHEKYPDMKITRLVIETDGDYVDLTCYTEAVPFERIRRITGYLVGTLDRFNDAKRAEVGDRVKHDTTPEPIIEQTM